MIEQAWITETGLLVTEDQYETAQVLFPIWYEIWQIKEREKSNDGETERS